MKDTRNKELYFKSRDGSNWEIWIDKFTKKARIAWCGVLCRKEVAVVGDLSDLGCLPKVAQKGDSYVVVAESKLLGGGTCCSREKTQPQNNSEEDSEEEITIEEPASDSKLTKHSKLKPRSRKPRSSQHSSEKQKQLADELLSKNKKLEEEFSELQSKNSKLIGTVEKFRAKEKQLSSSLQNLESIRNQKESELTELKNQLEELKTSQNSNDPVENTEKQLKETQKKLCNLEDEKQEAEARLKELKGKFSESQAVNLGLRKTIEERESDLERVQKEISEKEKTIQELGTKNSELNRTLELRENSIKQHETQLSELKGNLESKETQIQALEKRITEYEVQVEELEKECSSLKEERESLRSSREELFTEKNNLKRNLSELETQKKEYEDKTKQEIEQLKEDGIKEKHLRLLGAYYRKNDILRQSECYHKWNYASKQLLKSSKKVAQESTHEVVDSLKIQMAEENVLSREYEKIDKRVTPMSTVNFFKILEEMMDKKYSTDSKDLSEKRKPRSMTEFVSEFLQLKFGIKHLAQDALAKLLVALKQLVERKHPYAQFYARLLQIFEKDPVPYELSLYLVRARKKFVELVETANKFKFSQGITKRQPTDDQLADGGEAMLNDVLSLVQKEFQEDTTSGTLMFKLLKPASVTFVDYVCFVISYKMKKAGRRPEDIFNLLEKDTGGSIDAEEFISGTRSSLDLWLSDEEIKKFFREVDKSGDGEIDTHEFLECINFERYEACVKSPEYTVSKCCYLNCLIEVFNFRQLKDATEIEQILESQNIQELDFKKFEEVIVSLDKSIPPERIYELFNEALKLTEGESLVPNQVFVKVCVKNGVGGYGLGPFRIRELQQQLEERKYSVGESKRPGEEKRRADQRRSLKVPRLNPPSSSFSELPSSKRQKKRTLPNSYRNP